tara:strand:- start:161 stop:457 length:297 start_codon:yes stop_codon:yes gene_type:complete
MEIQDFVTVENGFGKFEGESGLANWYWQCVMNGDGEDFGPVWDGVAYTLFTVDADEADAFPNEVKCGDTVVIWEDSQGFVTMVAFATRAQALKFIPCH